MQGQQTEATIQRKRLKPSVFAPKLTEEQKFEVCQHVASFTPIAQIHKFLVKQYGPIVSLISLYKYVKSPHWKPLIDRLRGEWAAGVMEEPIAQKRMRLKKLTQLMDHAEADTKVPPWRRRMEIAKYLDQARLEIDEKKTDVTNLYLTQVNHYTDEELLKRRDELLSKLKQWRLPNAVGNTSEDRAETRGDLTEDHRGGEEVSPAPGDRTVEGEVTK